MAHEHPPSTAHIGGHPIHPMLIPLPLAAFIGVFATDLAFALGDGDPFWALASWWLLAAGLVTAALAALAGFADFLGSRRIRAIGIAWVHMLGNLTAVVLALVNLLMRSGGREAVAIEPTGLLLSALVFVLLGITGWAGGELVFRHGVAVVDESRHSDGRTD